MKEYRGKTYSVSCRQLGTEPTKEASWGAANSWWEAKEKELTGEEPVRTTLQRRLAVLSEAELTRLVDAGSLAGIVKDLKGESLDALEAAETHDGSVSFVLDSLTSVTHPVASSERTVKHWLDSWVTTLEILSKQQGTPSPGRVNSYRRHINDFGAWFGMGKDIGTVSSSTLTNWWQELCKRLDSRRWSAETCRMNFMTVKQFVRWCAEEEACGLPGNINSKRLSFTVVPGEIVTFSMAEVKTVLAASSDRDRLVWLLMLNCGMNQSDVSDLLGEEVDWREGTISRKRSKRAGKADAQIVTYPLWDETFALLKQEGNRKGRVLVSERGHPLVQYTLEKGKERCDSISSAWLRLQKKTGVKLPLKSFRKTSATALGSHSQFKYYASYFLAHSPKTIADAHYVKPSTEEFREAINWLRLQILK